MKADLSRDTFDPTRHFLRVLMQQGRVEVDADPNEQTAILLHYLQALAADLIGPAGGPKTEPNTPLGFSVEIRDNDLRIWPGHYYVDGILCELEPAPDREGAANDGTISYFEQPDYSRSRNDDPLPKSTFLAYLDVWERHLTALDDEHIREVALGGPDTATRSKVVWQVKAVTVEARTKDDALQKVWPGLVEKWQPPDRGALAAETDEPVDETDPCITPPASGYRGAENQLYRVEIVDPSPEATFVWSRENGSIVSRWDQSEDELVLVDPSRDHKLGFDAGQWIELTDDLHDLTSEPGTFAELTKVEHGVLTIDSATATGPTDAASFEINPKIRRWDSGAPQQVEVPATNDGWIPLEDGVQVKFSDTGHYRSGDYWLIPARVQGGVDWPIVAGDPVLLPPHGIQHHYAPLALFVGQAGAAFNLIPLQRSFEFYAK
jgi:Family of unknown function (DUF6519)